MDSGAMAQFGDSSQTWGVPLEAISCAHCGVAHLVVVGELPSTCPYCQHSPVMRRPELMRMEALEQMVPYGVEERALAEIVERWLRGVWLRPKELSPSLLLQRVHRYLIPAWLVDGHIEGPWQADVGSNYQVVSSQDRYREGEGWRSQQVRETRVSWEPRVGRLSRDYQNVVTSALEDRGALMDQVGPFDLDQRVAYQREMLAGAVIRLPMLDPGAAWPRVEPAFISAAEADCARATEADHIRQFAVEAQFGGLHWTLLVLPAYVTWYREGDEIWPVLINGQSGKVSGVRRASMQKARTASLGLGVAALLAFLIGALLAAAGLALPPLAAVGSILLVLGVVLAVLAPIPAVAVWAFNRRSRAPL